MFGQWSRPFSIFASGNCLANTSKIEKYSENDFGKSILFDPVVKKEYIVGTNSIEDINPLKKFKIGKIQVLSLFGNKIDKEKFANTIKSMQESIKNFQLTEVIY